MARIHEQEEHAAEQVEQAEDQAAAERNRLNELINELFWGYGESIEQIHFAINFYDDGSPLVDADGNVLPQVAVEYIEQVIANVFR